MNPSKSTWLWLLLLAGLVGCQAAETTPTPPPTPLPPTSFPLLPEPAGIYGYTHVRADGNRIADGRGNLPNATPIDISLDGEVIWLVAAPLEDDMLWVATLADGRVQAFRVTRSGDVTSFEIAPATLPAGSPPLLYVNGASAQLIGIEGAAPFSHPIALGNGLFAAIQPDGTVQTSDATRFDVALGLPDARLTSDGAGRALLLGAPTDRYRHAVLGDALEAGSLLLLDTTQEPPQLTAIPLDADYVVEGIQPIWTDLDGDGTREIILTRANSDVGAQVVVVNAQGELLAAGPAVGRGNRWRNQLGAGPFGPNGEIEIVDVLTPHIGGTVEFYQWQGDELVVVGRVPGMTSHQIGSRNLDLAIGGDFDGDGRLEVLVPSQNRAQLNGIQREELGATVVWSLPAGPNAAKIVTNIATVTFADGALAVGAGHADNGLRLWLPEP